jgi:hypothetical protein
MKMLQHRKRSAALGVAVALSVGMVACGDGDNPITKTTITGSAVKGPVSGATVTAKKADGTNCGSATTTSSGTYTLETTCTGDLIIEVSGGTYTDEASGQSTALSTPLKVVIAANGGSVTGVATPFTTMAFSTAFGSSSAATKAAFDLKAAQIANQFGLNGVNLATTLPVVSGTTDDYGKALRAISQYLQDNTLTLETITNATFNSDLSAFATAYNAAFSTINGSTVSLSFDDGVFTVGGTGAGGGSGSCGVAVSGTVSTGGFTVPLNLNYCITGLQGSCDSGNTSLSQSLSGQQGLAGGVNLNYTYSSTCASGALTINIAS